MEDHVGQGRQALVPAHDGRHHGFAFGGFDEIRHALANHGGGFGDPRFRGVVLDLDRLVQRYILAGTLRNKPVEQYKIDQAHDRKHRAHRREIEHGEGRAHHFAANARNDDIG